MGGPIKLAELFFFLNMGGVERNILNLMNHLPYSDFKKSVYVTHFGGLMEKELAKEVEFFCLEPGKRMSSLISHLKKTDIAHINTSNFNPFFTWSAALANVPLCIETVHAPVVDNPYVSYLDFTVCISQHVAELQARPEKTCVIYNGVNVQKQPLSLKRRDNKSVILAEMRRPDKAMIASLVDLAPLMSRSDLQVECWIIGVEGQSRGNLTYMGKMGDPSPILAQADFLVHFPENEAFGNVLIEGMAQGALPITCPVGGISEVVQDGVNGICKSISKRRDILQLLIELVNAYANNPAPFEKLRAAGLSTVRNKFSVEQSARTYAELFKKLCDRKTQEKHRSLSKLISQGNLEDHSEFLSLLEDFCFNPAQGLARIQPGGWLHLTKAQRAFLHVVLGQELMAQGQMNEAEKQFHQALSLGAEDFYLHQAMGEINFKAENFIEAEHHFAKAFAVDQTHMATVLSYLQCLIKNQDLDTAKKICTDLLSRLPKQDKTSKVLQFISQKFGFNIE